MSEKGEQVEIDIISETQEIKDSTKVGSAKRRASKLAGKLGLGRLADKLNPDIEVTFEEPIDPDQIKVTPVERKEEEREVEEPRDEMDFEVKEVDKFRRVSREIPSGTRLVGDRESRTGFERIIAEGRAMDKMTEFMREDMGNESGGVLVGYYCRDPRSGEEFTYILDFIPNEEGANDWGRLGFSAENWNKLTRQIDQMSEGQSDELIMVGWSHSHPAGVELTPASDSPDEAGTGYGDRMIMRNYFPKTRQLTMIYGKGGSYDNQYAIWRPFEGKAIRQKGFEVSGVEAEPSYGYYTRFSELELESSNQE